MSSNWIYSALILLAFIPAVVCIAETQLITAEELEKRISQMPSVSTRNLITLSDNSVTNNFYAVAASADRVEQDKVIAELQILKTELAKLRAEVAAGFKAQSDQIDALPIKTAESVIELQLNRTAAAMETTPENLVSMATKTFDFLHKARIYVATKLVGLDWIVDRLYVLGAGDHSFNWGFILIPATTSTFHFMCNVYYSPSLTVTEPIGVVLFWQAFNAVADFLISYLSSIAASGSIGHFVASVLLLVTVILVHWALLKNTIALKVERDARNAQASVVQALKRETESREREEKVMKKQQSVTSDFMARQAKLVQPAPRKAVSFLSYGEHE